MHLYISRQALDEKFTVEIVTSKDPNKSPQKDWLHTVLEKERKVRMLFRTIF